MTYQKTTQISTKDETSDGPSAENTSQLNRDKTHGELSYIYVDNALQGYSTSKYIKVSKE